MCQDLFPDEAPYGSILVNDQLPQATTKLCILDGRLTQGGSTVLYLQ